MESQTLVPQMICGLPGRLTCCVVLLFGVSTAHLKAGKIPRLERFGTWNRLGTWKDPVRRQLPDIHAEVETK